MVLATIKSRTTLHAYHVLCLLLINSLVSAIVSPHPDANFDEKSWSAINQHRRKLGIKYGYNTKFLSPELCRHENEATCQKMDEAMQKQARRTLTTIQDTGKLKTLVLLLRFDNHKDREMINPTDIDKFFNADGRDSVLYPTGSIKTYLKINSHDSLNIDSDIISWYLTNKTEKECSFDSYGLKQDFQQCFSPILEALDTLHSNPKHEFNWTTYDEDMDGVIDSLVVMHSGYGAEYGKTDPDGVTAENRIWSHSMGPQMNGGWNSSSGSYRLGTYAVVSAFHGHESQNITKIGVVLRELLHTFGLPDLFDTSRDDQGGGIGSYSIMSNAWGQGNDGTFPGHLDPWSKITLGWVTPKRIVASGTYSMLPSEYEPDIYIIEEPYPEGEYLLIENRQKVLYDGKMWEGAGGALVWHIDESKDQNNQAGGPYQSGWPENGNHYKVALLQADGLYELEQQINGGHADDFYTTGGSLGPGGSGVYPNTDSYQDEGNIVSTNLTIADFQQDKFKVTFTVTGFPDLSSTGDSVQEEPRCHVNVNLGQCSGFSTADIQPQEDCDCYNFCGNGRTQTCCKFNEPCPIDCEPGGLVAGCVFEVEDSDADVDSESDPDENSDSDGESDDSTGPGLGLPMDDKIVVEEQPDADEDTGNLRSKSFATTWRASTGFSIVFVSMTLALIVIL
eukprot:scaffold1706_cov116-Cylindrotheca_fusiformis.AAC.4